MSTGGAPTLAPAQAYPPAQSADAELAGRMATGDPGALEELYDRYAPAVFGLLARLVPDPHRREAILEDVFLTVWRRAAGYDGRRGQLSSWLMAIAHHKAIDFLRRRRHDGMGSPSAGRAAAEAPTAHPPARGGPVDGYREDAVEGQLQGLPDGEAILGALQLLPPEEQQVLILAFFRGYTHKEIASRFSIPLGTVKSRMRSAVERLRQLMAVQQQPDRRADEGERQEVGPR